MTRVLRYFSKPEFAPLRLRVETFKALTFKALADGAISFGTIENLIKNPKAPAPTGDHPRTIRPCNYSLTLCSSCALFSRQ